MSFASGSRGGRIAERLVERNGFRPLKWKFAWDGRDHLAHTITPDDHKWAYQYDPFRRRNSKTQYILADNDSRPGEPANRQWQEVSQHCFLWDGDVLVWEDVSGVKTEWHFEPDTFVPLAKRTAPVLDDPGGGAGQGKRNAADGDRQALAPSRENGSVATNSGAKEARLWYVVTDHLGTPREMLSEDGSLVWAAEYTTWGSVRRLWQADNDTGPLGNFQGHDPDGNPVYSTRVYGTDGNAALKAIERPNEYACPIRFQGQWADEETGLYYNRFRYYDPGTAQYMSPDPIGISAGFRYLGFVDNPTKQSDTLGLATQVPYGSTDLSRLVVGARIGAGDKNPYRNYAAAKVCRNGKEKIILAKNVPKTNTHPGLHAEEVLAGKLLPGDKVTSLYIERFPCPRCAGLLNFDPRFLGAPVTCSFPRGNIAAQGIGRYFQ